MAGTALKQRTKQMLRRTVGEPYVGKRLKMRWLNARMGDIHLNPTAILDAGSEDATFVYWLADRFRHARVTAIDLDEQAIEACLASRPARYAARVKFATTPFDALQANSYDLITIFDVLEHIEDDHQAMIDLVRALRPGGSIMIHVPFGDFRDQRGTTHHVTAEMASTINASHVRPGYTPAELTALVESVGLHVVKCERWQRHWSAWAHYVYARLEHPAALRVVTLPITDVLAWLDRRRPATEGNTTFMLAMKPNR